MLPWQQGHACCLSGSVVRVACVFVGKGRGQRWVGPSCLQRGWLPRRADHGAASLDHCTCIRCVVGGRGGEGLAHMQWSLTSSL